MENLLRIREPLTWALLAAAVAAMAMTALARGTAEGGWSRLSEGPVLPAELALALVGAVVGCAAKPAVAHARPLALAAAVLLGLATVTTGFSVAAALPGSAVGGKPAIWIVSLTVTGLGAVALWALALPVRPKAQGGLLAAPEPPRVADIDRTAPVWEPGHAAGAAWRTADEAAAGVPGSSSFPRQVDEGGELTDGP